MGDAGVTGVRDPDFPCEDYETTPLLKPAGRCDGDGHYLCAGCIHHNAAVERPTFVRIRLPEQRATALGNPPAPGGPR